MKFISPSRIRAFLLLTAFSGLGFAGGRYADPPPGLVEVHKTSTEALEAARANDKDAALAKANEARKLAIDSYKTKSTMPMQNSSSRLKAAVAAIQGGKVADAVGPLEETVNLLTEEISFYKKEGKL
jgi:hypothetical protein